MNNCATNTCASGQQKSYPKAMLAGGVGGIAGGIVFGMMMAQMGMLSMIAGMMGSKNPLVGFGIHMMISIFFGVIWGMISPLLPTCPVKLGLAAMSYGVLLWVVGPLVVMPMMMKMPLFAITEASLMSLMGHIIYALLTGYGARLFSVKVCQGE